MKLSMSTMRDLVRLRMYHKDGLEDLLEIAEDCNRDDDIGDPIEQEETVETSDGRDSVTASQVIEECENYTDKMVHLN